MARRGLAVLAVVLAAVCSVAAADTAPPADPVVTHAIEQVHGVYLADGEQAVLRLDAQGKLIIVSRAEGVAPSTPAPANDPKVESVFQFRGGSLRAEPATLVASFNSFGAKGVAVRVDNGFDHPMIYDAEIVVRRHGGLGVAPTSVCPVGVKRAGVESWPAGLVGLIIFNAREASGAGGQCSGGTGMVTTSAIKPNTCQGAAAAAAPVQVMLDVDPLSGRPLRTSAVWELHDIGQNGLGPTVRLYYPMQGEAVGGMPDAAAVGAFAGMGTDRPSAKTASIVLVADGVEAVRRPWQLYARQMAAPPPTPPGQRPVFFFGVIPFPLRGPDGAADPKLLPLFEAIGAGKVVRLEARVEGDDGKLIGRSVFDLSSADVRDDAKVLAALHDAEAKAQAGPLPSFALPETRLKSQAWPFARGGVVGW